MIDTNIKGLLYVTRIVSSWMVERQHGHIINIASTAGKECYPNGNVYSATKFAVDSLTKSMRLDLYKHNIRVSQVAPGHVEETEFAITRFDGDAERARIYDDFTPLRAKDVAETIIYIATRPPHVNIQDILIMSTQQASATNVDRSGRKEKYVKD
jgi:NADP-dependent 3-hydroxy acid dehydrogenase YdfG